MTEPTNLAEFILAEVHRQTSEDELRKIVEQKIGACVKEAVDRSMRSFGNVGQQIEKAVGKALEIGDQVDVPSYGNMVMAVLRAKMDEVLTPLVNGRLAAEMNDILKLAPKEVKLSDIVKLLVDDVDAQDRYGSSITCIVEDSQTVIGYQHIYLDPEMEKRKYECAVQLGVDPAGKIYSLTIERKDARTTVVLGEYDPYKKALFAAYCCGSKFIVDEEFISTGIGDH